VQLLAAAVAALLLSFVLGRFLAAPPTSVYAHALQAALPATGSAISYQGILSDGGGPLNGTCDLRFALYDALESGNQIGSNDDIMAVAMSSGVFTVLVNANDEFGGDAFNGNARYLSLAVRCPADSGDYTTLTPRSQLTAGVHGRGCCRSRHRPITGRCSLSRRAAANTTRCRRPSTR
jgi:hypothetical protein